jgi:hypothetical protein
LVGISPEDVLDDHYRLLHYVGNLGLNELEENVNTLVRR